MEIVTSFNPTNREDPLAEIARPPKGATMVELRADLFPPGFSLEQAVRACPLPVVLTLRSRAEGGQGPEDGESRTAFFQAAKAWPVALFDLEASRDLSLLGSVVPREKALVSSHFPDTPADLEERMGRLLALGTRYVKLVPTAHMLSQLLAVLRLADALSRGTNGNRRGIVFAQGEVGVASRLLSPLLAAPVAYACWDGHGPVAPGQLTPAELLAQVGHLSARPKKIYAVLGKEAHRSLSPLMHAAGFKALGLPFAFVPFTVRTEEELEMLLRPANSGPLDALGLVTGGFAVTMPWKEKAALFCQLLTPRAERARAVNTVLPRPDKLIGDLTDVDGITRVLLEAGLRLGGTRVAVLGTGGAARAVLVALQLGGSQALVVGRDPKKVEQLAREFKAKPANPEDLEEARAVINATPAGADGQEDKFLTRLRLASSCVVVDMVYGARPTFLAQLAQDRGWDFVDGKEVLLYQGISQFAAMNGVAPPARAMAAALDLKEVSG